MNSGPVNLATEDDAFNLFWIDGYREPKSPPNRLYPRGMDVDISTEGKPRCFIKLPWPAARCGHYEIECKTCGFQARLTTAGRADDPRSIMLPCKTVPPA